MRTYNLVYFISTLSLITTHVFATNLMYGPSGFISVPECTYAIEEGEILSQQVDGTIKVVSANGNTRFLPVCVTKQVPPKKDKADNGWLMYGFMQGKNFQFLRTLWTVPNPPPQFDKQLFYFFNGIETFYEIVQPVLQWGVSPAGGGPFWAMASWWTTSNGQALHSTLIPVRPGDQIVGMMIATSPGNWFITVMDLNTNQQSSLNVHNTGTLIYATIAMEAYNVNSCRNYPVGPLNFNQSQIADSGVFLNNINWSTGVAVHSCNQTIRCVGANCAFYWQNG